MTALRVLIVPALLAPLLTGCGGAPAWAVQAGSVVPRDSGLDGVQAWSFFTARWGAAGDDAAFVCARSQTLTGTGAAPLPGCASCTAAYTLATAEIETDCEGDEATDPSYTLPVAMAIGPVDASLADVDPYEGRSLGWYASFDGQTLEPYGLVWDAAFDTGADPGPPGWNPGQSYTLWSAYAWDLAGSADGA